MINSNFNPQYTYHFITILTKHRKNYFGEIRSGKMHLTSAGIIANILWDIIGNCRPNLIKDEFVIMPDHMHGILMVDKTQDVNTYLDRDHEKYNRHEIYIKNIIKSYKSTVKKYTNRFELDFTWQDSCHHRYIQSTSSLFSTRQYVKNNITAWSLKNDSHF